MVNYINLVRKLVAFIRRTFVTDCPRCHKHFYGFHSYMIQVKFDIHYRIVCHNCAKQYKELENKAV